MKRKSKFLIIFTLLFFSIMTSVNAAPAWLSGNKVSCGNIDNIPAKGPEIVSMFILVAQIAIPVILVIFGIIDFAKGIMSQKDDEIKKGQKTFISRLIVGVLVFFIVALSKALISVVASNNSGMIISCVNCFTNNECS